MVGQIITSDKTDVSLVPYSGIQFLTYTFNFDTYSRPSRDYVWRPKVVSSSDPATRYELLAQSDDFDDQGQPTLNPKPDDKIISVSKSRALDTFTGHWIPVPYLAAKNALDRPYAEGPCNWARVRVAKLDQQPVPGAEGTPGPTHAIVFAFDTELLPRTGGLYLGPSEEDARDRQQFKLASRIADIGWVLSSPEIGKNESAFRERQDWVSRWIDSILLAQQRPGRVIEDFPMESASRYLSFIDLIASAIKPPTIRFIDNVTTSLNAFDVDLVLDIGNSRTCGILMENHPNENHNEIANASVLKLRDLGEPHLTYSDPFESHVELVHADFGLEAFARHHGMRFFWPSPVRVGPEVARIRAQTAGNETASGISSPKRYLWDFEPATQDWRIIKSPGYAETDPPQIERALRKFVNARGDVLREIEQKAEFYRGFQTRSRKVDVNVRAGRSLSFSRSSFFTFMLAEIVLQAMAQINSPDYRRDRRFQDLPRRLRKVILTVPTAMTIREQRILRSRADATVKLIEEIQKFGRNGTMKGDPLPRVEIGWDEASCCQFVYLYNEITQKFGGNVSDFVNLLGSPRAYCPAEQTPDANAKLQPSLRVASVDVGGGTTDLMIATYYVEDRVALKPVQVFREGFRLAGDDVLGTVVQRVVMPGIQDGLTKSGVRAANDLLNVLFGGDKAGMSEQDKHLRRQFVLQVLEPIALAVLRDYEDSDLKNSDVGRTQSVRQLIEEGQVPPISPRVRGYLESPAHRSGATTFAIEDCEIFFDYQKMRESVTAVLAPVFDNIAEAIHHFQPDVVLLSGRPSRLPATLDLLVDKLPIAPDRILPLHRYVIGPWYPFRELNNIFISDPKTTAVVGAMLCTFVQANRIRNLTVDISGFKLRSTVKYIGRVESGRLRGEDIHFTPVSGLRGQDELAELRYHAPIVLGARQLPVERWSASPLYYLRLQGGEATENLRLPILVRLRRQRPEEADAETQSFGSAAVLNYLREEAKNEELMIESAESITGTPAKAYMNLTLETMIRGDEGYWLDTGIIFLN